MAPLNSSLIMFRRVALTATEPQQRIRAGLSRRSASAKAGGRPWMKRACTGIVLVIAAAMNGGIVRGQGANDPGILKRNFSPVAYLKASNPRADAKLGFGSA